MPERIAGPAAPSFQRFFPAEAVGFEEEPEHASSLYPQFFFKHISESERRSANVVVPLVMELIRPRSVVDVGCGAGGWLSVFREHGVAEILGFDGPYVAEGTLQIPVKAFVGYDLTKPLCLDRQFDLVVSLEVAEHLPPESAETFVDSLTRLGPVVLFSAAIPFQGGRNHINEQWPDYWAALFAQRGYVPVDCLRGAVWQNCDVEWYYAQNILFFVQSDALARLPALARAAGGAGSPLSIVHPTVYLKKTRLAERYAGSPDPARISLRKAVGMLPLVVMHAAKRRWSRFFSFATGPER